ncbi:hypothetical protein [Acinetobacter sp. SEK570]|uniref:hypothetical protein n=1 Tax=unclassified Acinetobacter TaxID=196816 RepID=UPI0039A113C9
MDTDSTTEQLNQCLAALASSQQHWWEYLAITQSQSDEITLMIVRVMAGCIAYALVSLILKRA